ncbi:site-specific integrase [Beijerinckia sp. L45]|uniref:site-specific integrase n=1 Tax=Beijerinckia sp. L45 TaxID=1641855 RepID=UPI00131E8091|nr:site-specific integrase [Beijerinckia sp. L45]
MPSFSTKLTRRSVDSAAPQPGRYFLWDSELKGFALRVAESGTKTYVVRYRPRGIGRGAPKRFVVLGRHGPVTPEEARARAKAILGAVAAGQDPALQAAHPALAITLNDLVDTFINEHVEAKRKARTATGYAAILHKNVVPRFGKRAADGIARNEIAQLHLSMRNRPYLANRVLAIVASMYSFARKAGLVPKGTNPTEGIERYRESSRERYLTTDELNRLGETLRLAESAGLPWKMDTEKPASKHLPKPDDRRTVLPTEAVLAIRLLLFTGARLREILHLEWCHVDLDRGLMLLPDSKTGRKTIVMSTLVVALLRASTRSGRYVIPGAGADRPRSDLKKPWQAVQRHAGLEGVRLHDLRHTFASIGAGASLGLPIVGKLLGHAQPATTARYAHLDADPLRRATNLIGDQLAGALAEQVKAALPE